MICQRLPDDVSESSVCSCEGLGEVYDLLAQADPSFAKRHTKDDYLARLLFLKRGGGQFFKLCLQGRAAAVGGILLPEGCDYGLILNLCTLPEFRGQGLGGQLVSRLCLEAFWQGKNAAARLCGPTAGELLSEAGLCHNFRVEEQAAVDKKNRGDKKGDRNQ